MNEKKELEKDMQEEMDNTTELMDEEVEEKLSLGEKLKYFFSEPSKTMEDLALNPIIYPIFIIAVIFMMLIIPKVNMLVDYSIPQIIESYRQQGVNITASELPATVITMTKVGLIIGGFITPLIGWVLNSVVIIILALITRCKGRLKGVLSVVAFSSIISVIGEAIRTIIALITGNPEVNTSLVSIGQLINPNMATDNPILYSVMGSFEIFNLIFLYFVALGLTYVYKISLKKAAAISYGNWALMVIIVLGIGQLF
ncbi:YIP1 family protein [Alkaliphilus pronyensis]|uniref:YIP1 family protein n=1 Tax=Alkaliphilus pronyensis TaxID=1482732 RepID=A0A6I0FES9_9FIRM|nr:YIP1 family protein [Alkaliphilus pronyensis]KAB3534134.1 YIP1 family protein [Alkaliphilus pronyensis]